MVVASPKRRKAQRRGTEFGLPAGCDTFNRPQGPGLRPQGEPGPRQSARRGPQQEPGTPYNASMSRRVGAAVGVTVALLGTVAIGIAQGGRQGRGDRQPDTPLPNIREYKPTSTLVVPEHLVPRAKFPVIDMHGHPPPLTSPEAVERVVGAMDPLNLRIMAVTGHPGRISREQMRQDLDVVGASKHKDRFAIFANIDFRNVAPGFGQMAAEQLEADVKAGAVGLGEIMKDVGLTARRADGSRLKLDDPELDPIWS